jgi:hypothetical protein
MVLDPMKRVFLLLLVFLALVVGAQAQMSLLTGAGGKFRSGGGGGGPPSYTGPGDVVSGAVFWGGLRCYSNANAGSNAVRVRRASDNAEQDVALTASCGLTDVSATFCASTTCFVKTLYDQSGNGNDITQTTSASQPQLVYSCNGSLPCMTFDGTDDFWGPVTTTPAPANPLTASAVAMRNLAGRGGTNYVFAIDVAGAMGWLGDDQLFIDNVELTATATDAAWHALQSVYVAHDAGASTINVDGTETTGVIGFDVAFPNLYIGIFADSVSGPLNGKISEFGFWNVQFTSTQQHDVCANQQSYWSTPACAAAPTYAGPGDVMGTATAWHGLRCYSAANASTNAIRIRRASDNTETNVALTASCNLTDVSGTFCSGTTCFVKTMYDQTGNGNDLTQATNSKQPQLSFSCIGSKPCMLFVLANSTILESSTLPTVSQPMTLSSVDRRDVNPSAFTSIYGATSSPESSDRPIHGYTNTSGIAFCYAGSLGSQSSTASDSVWHSLQTVFNGASSIIGSDSSINTTDCGTGAFTGTSKLGFGGETITPQYMDGKGVEAGLWPRGYSASGLTALCRNQQSYWGSGNFEGSC